MLTEAWIEMLKDIFLGVPIIRTIVFLGRYWGPAILGNYRMPLEVECTCRASEGSMHRTSPQGGFKAADFAEARMLEHDFAPIPNQRPTYGLKPIACICTGGRTIMTPLATVLQLVNLATDMDRQ